MYVSHFIDVPGYVYAYAFGELLVLALYNIYQQEVDTNRALYDGLLQRFVQAGAVQEDSLPASGLEDPVELGQAPLGVGPELE